MTPNPTAVIRGAVRDLLAEKAAKRNTSDQSKPPPQNRAERRAAAKQARKQGT